MTAQDIVSKNKIIESHVGSKLYGTDLPTSDVDIAGIFIPPVEYLFGLQKIEDVDNSLVSKDQSGKNTKDAIDQKYYSLHKFVNLAICGSPNVIERLFVPKDKMIFCNEYGQSLLDNKELFLTQKIIPKFLGYAHSQRHKMVIRTDNFSSMNSFLDFLVRFEHRQILIEIKNDKNYELFGAFKGDVFSVGDLALNRTILIKDARRIVEERLSKVSNRKELMLKHGFDTKFASHLIRLLLQCEELLETGNLILPLKYAEQIKDIKTGKVNINDVLKYAEDLEDKIRSIKTNLPEKEDFNKINELVIDLVSGWNDITLYT